MKLVCYTLDAPAEIAPGSPQRPWMDAFNERHPYRCLPMVVANTTGWEIRCPFDFIARWTGGTRVEDVRIDADETTAAESVRRTVRSHFSGGVLTFHTGYLFRTDPGWDLWVGGPPNAGKDGIAPLTGVVETAWLPFPFTMNWRFTRPGMVSFRQGEPFCFIMPILHGAIDEVEPIVRPLADDPALAADYRQWTLSRAAFNARVQAGEPTDDAWQQHYFHGRHPHRDEADPTGHLNRRRLRAPRPPRPDE